MIHTFRIVLVRTLAAWTLWLLSVHMSPNLLAQSGGEVAGRVINGGTGNYLNNARVAVEGTKVEALTDEAGRYRLSGVPSGEVKLVVSYAGFQTESATVEIAEGASTRQDFTLLLALRDAVSVDDGGLVLESYTVSERILSGQAQAMNEQKQAPNIKTVVSLEEFPDMGEGNVGEFMKFVPGVALNYNPQSPAEASIRGMPSSGTIVTLDGMSMASSGANGRAFDLAQGAVGNVDRIEVTKVPTPDMPANAVGGGVNIVSKSGFSRKKPLLTYNVFGTYTALDGIESPGSGSTRATRADGRSTTSRYQPAYNLSYLLPVNDKLAFTFALSESMRYNDWQTLRPVWDKVRRVQSSQQNTHAPLEEDKFLASGSMEWRISPEHTVRLSAQRTKQEITLRQHSIVTTSGAGATRGTLENGLSFTQGAATRVGSSSEAFGWNNQYKPLTQFTGLYKFQRDAWKFDLGGSFSKAGISLLDTDDGFFANISTTLSGLAVRFEGDSLAPERRIPVITAMRAAGSVNIYDAANYTINSATASNRRIRDEVSRVATNLSREFEGGRWSATVKIGAAVEQRDVNDTSAAQTYTFSPPGGAAGRLAANHDVVDERYSAGRYFTDAQGNDVNVRFISPAKLFQLAQANPTWFVLNQPAAHTAKVNATKELVETITAGYLRADLKLFDNRLWLVGGVRYEKTTDEGRGPLDAIGNTYRRDANGNLVLGPNETPVLITTDPLQLAQLRYTLLGTGVEKSYDGLYPSLNSTFAITDTLLVRAAYARTIGRPNFTEVIPSVVATDPTANPGSRTVNVVNTGLKPWTADNFDLSFEAYGIKGAVATVSLFRKDITDFFGQTRTAATPALLEDLGLSDEYLTYDIITKRNAGDATLDGVELSYRQSIDVFLPAAKGLQVYGNLTYMDLDGPNEADFVNFVPVTVNYGVSYTRARFRGDVSVAHFTERRIQPVVSNATTETNSYLHNPSNTSVSASLEYRFSRRYALYGSARNLFAKPLARGTWAETTPEFARVDQYQFTGAMFSFGVKGSF